MWKEKVDVRTAHPDVMSTSTRFKLRVCTWNVGNAQPCVDLHDWLGTNAEDSDIVAVGAQEANFGTEKAQSPSQKSSPISNIDLQRLESNRHLTDSSCSLAQKSFSSSSTSAKLRKLSRAVRAARRWRADKKDGGKDSNHTLGTDAKRNEVDGFSSVIPSDGITVESQNGGSKDIQDPRIGGRTSLSFPLPGNATKTTQGQRQRFSDDADCVVGSSKNCSLDDDDNDFHVPTQQFEDLEDLHPRNVDTAKAGVDRNFGRSYSQGDEHHFIGIQETSPVSRPLSEDGEPAELLDDGVLLDEPCHKQPNPQADTRLRRVLTGNWVRKLQSDIDVEESPWKPALPSVLDEESSNKESQNTGNQMKKFSKVIENSMPDGYELVAKYHLMEIKLLVFVHERHRSRVVKTERMSEGTGIGNMLGNKGGVAVKLTIDDTTFCFVCSHLAAHEGAKFLQQRNEDVIEIMRNVERNKGKYGLPVMHQYTHLFWMGDLNYRLDLKRVIPAAITWSHQDRWCYIIDMIANRRFAEIAEFDELIHEMALGNVFSGFEEGQITFSPTFKVERGMRYSSYQSLRLPSYCDRILWHSLPLHKNHVKLVEYSSVPRIDSSDHKPVYAVFDMVIPLPVRIISLPAPRDSVKCVIDFKKLVLHGLYEKRTEADDGIFQYEVLSDGALALQDKAVGQKPMNALRRMETDISPSHTTRKVHADFHGMGIFIKERPYRADIPLKDGKQRICEYEQLPKIPLRPVERLGDLTYKYVTVVFTRFGTKQGSSCLLPLSSLVQHEGRHVATQMLDLTKYGSAIAKVELEVELVVSMEAWIDSKNNVVRVKR